ncbi:hypothetical protein [Thermosipho sp. (in: thermotogales)]|jgi:hypothetical protein|uniref:hypothetical protein n=1 Tax=Thermosipho sp. (in: thermotogales) TaxID=1968895 RepID=UPI00257BA7FF|nr:hypothetical protein [Thermosipho sp. (in: thermotogales)]MBZ4649267.1 hypothetical protein [Thermosipho sp. (in: thermotogales)]
MSAKKISKAIDAVVTKMNNEPTFKEVPPDIVRVKSQSSVEITQGDKGVRFSIKIYDDNPLQASKTAQAIYDELIKKFSK